MIDCALTVITAGYGVDYGASHTRIERLRVVMFPKCNVTSQWSNTQLGSHPVNYKGKSLVSVKKKQNRWLICSALMFTYDTYYLPNVFR